jgi:NAD(P)H-hydrate epimerase
MITAERMAQVDANAVALGVPRKQLMESSGNALARAVREETDPGDEVVVLAGRGNNGGDAFVAARFLDDREVTTFLVGRRATISTDIARQNWDALRNGEYDARELRNSTAIEVPDAEVVVDALLGTGLGGAPREPAATAIAATNDADATVVSVDVPSGLDADTGDAAGAVVDADRVVTFHDDKPGLADLDAEVTVADIGIPETAELFVEAGDLLAVDRDPDSHKGDNGEVLVVGGGPYTGAPALAAQAALRAGTDLVRVACPESVAREVQGYSEALIVRPLTGEQLRPGHVDELLELAGDHDAVVFGPGLGEAERTRAAATEFLGAFDGRVVVDADALSVVPDIDTDAELVCTPHQGELREMGGSTAEGWRERADAVGELAAELGHTLLVKGRYDVVAAPGETRVNRTGNAAMTVGGTGDVLAGITGSLLARLPPLQAGAIGAYVTGRAGDLAVGDGETPEQYGLLPTDLPERVPAALWGDRP